MLDTQSEQLSNQLERVKFEIRRLLPAENYGLRKAIENGIAGANYEEQKGISRFTGKINIGIPPNIVSYECLSGSIFARGLLESKFGISTKFANAGPKESKFLFRNDVVLVLPDEKILRIVPLYPIIDKINFGEHYKIGNVDTETLDLTQKGQHRIEIIQHDYGFPLSGFTKMGTHIISGIRFNYATPHHIYLIHQTVVGKGSRLTKRINIVVDIPKSADFFKINPDLESMMTAGLGLPVYLEEDGLFLAGDLRSFKKIEIQDQTDISGKTKATRLESFMRDSKAICQIAKSISGAFYQQK